MDYFEAKLQTWSMIQKANLKRGLYETAFIHILFNTNSIKFQNLPLSSVLMHSMTKDKPVSLWWDLGHFLGQLRHALFIMVQYFFFFSPLFKKIAHDKGAGG